MSYNPVLIENVEIKQSCLIRQICIYHLLLCIAVKNTGQPLRKYNLYPMFEQFWKVPYQPMIDLFPYE